MMQKGFVSDIGPGLRMDYMTGLLVMPHAHLHPQWELYFCPSEIEQVIVINGTEYSVCHPCAILSRPYTVHSMSCGGTVRGMYERFVLYFGERTVASVGNKLFPEAWPEDKQSILFELNHGQAAYLKQLLRTVRDETYPATEAEKELLLCLFIHKLFDFCPPDKITRVGNTAFYIQDVLRFLSENVSKTEDGDQVAKRFAVSRSKLDRDFKRAVGMTLHEFSDICRLHYAKMLLRRRERMTVGEISEACGFRNETYFFAFFKKHTGRSPSEFRMEKGAERAASGKTQNDCT